MVEYDGHMLSVLQAELINEERKRPILRIIKCLEPERELPHGVARVRVTQLWPQNSITESSSSINSWEVPMTANNRQWANY